MSHTSIIKYVSPPEMDWYVCTLDKNILQYLCLHHITNTIVHIIYLRSFNSKRTDDIFELERAREVVSIWMVAYTRGVCIGSMHNAGKGERMEKSTCRCGDD